jgi:hypothetical protein
MDQSEKEDCLRSNFSLLETMGMPPFIISWCLELCKMDYKAFGKLIKIAGSVGYQLPTGLDLTTVLNSITTISWNVRKRLNSLQGSAAAYDLGLKLKEQAHARLEDATFLKGWFIAAREHAGVVWAPLPSQVLKISKTLRDPRLFSPVREHVDGLKKFAYAMGRSMGTIPRDYPILGPFLAMYDRLGSKTSMVVSASEDQWFKPTLFGSVDRASAAKSICYRYDITYTDIERVEALFAKIEQLPCLMADPVFDRFAEVDY